MRNTGEKSVLSVFMLLTMIIALTFSGCSRIPPEETVQPVGGDVVIETVSGEVEIPIIISKNDGIATLGFAVEYDSSSMRYIGCECGAVFTEGQMMVNDNADGKIIISTIDSVNHFETGTLVTLFFSLSSNGESTVNLDFSSDSIRFGAFSESGSQLEISTVGTSVSVTLGSGTAG